MSVIYGTANRARMSWLIEETAGQTTREVDFSGQVQVDKTGAVAGQADVIAIGQLAGVQVGDYVRLWNMTQAANNAIWVIAALVDADTVTVTDGSDAMVDDTTADANLRSTPSYQTARVTSSSLLPDKATEVSAELRADRMVSDTQEVGFTSGGDWPFELSLGGTWDEMLQAIFGGTFSNVVQFQGALDIVGGAGTATVADAGAAGTAFASAVVGQKLYLYGTGLANGDGWYPISVVNSNDQVTVLDPAGNLTTVTTPASAQAVSKVLRNGVVKRAFTLLQELLDTSFFEKFNGQEAGTWSLNVAANSLVTGSIGFTGLQLTEDEEQPWGSDYLPPTTTSVVNATSNVGQVIVDGAPYAGIIESITINVDNAPRSLQGVGLKYPGAINMGRQTITGQLAYYFSTAELFKKFLAHEYGSLAFGFSDLAGNAMTFDLPKVTFTSDDTAPSGGIDTDIMATLEWQAVANDAQTHQIEISVANVV